MAHKYIKRSSISLTFREMQVKTSIRYHLIHIRMTIIKKKNDNRAGEDVEKMEPLCTADGNINC